MKQKGIANDKELCVSFVPNGGVNLASSPARISENQAAGMLNMYSDERSLRLRPGIKKMCEIESVYGSIKDVYPRDGRRLLLKRITHGENITEEKHGIYIATQKAVLSFDGESFERVPCFAEYSSGVWNYQYSDFNFNACVFLPSAGVELTENDGQANWKAEGDTVYLFGSGCTYIITPQVIYWPFPIGQVHICANYFVVTRPPYVPIILNDCSPAGDGVKGEARNLLTEAVTQAYTANSQSTAYKLNDSNIDDDTVTACYTNPLSKVKLEFVFDADEVTQTRSGITVTLHRGEGTLTFSQPPITAAGVKNNVTVTYSKTPITKAPVLNCTVGGWFGSGRNGGGSHIVLGGYSTAKNLVYYSKSEDPSYFPEDFFVTVGDPSDAVTAFGVQFNTLVIFKNHSIFCLESPATQEGFTVRQVHAGDGCDIPKSVQLVHNALVWANSTGGMFMLYSALVRDERAVRTISKSINSELLSNEKALLENACSVSDGKYYYLFVGENVYLWHFENASLNSAVASSKYDSFAFYIWRLKAKLSCPFMFNSKLCAFEEESNFLMQFDESLYDDDGTWFEAFYYSKAFDFDLLQNLKTANELYISFFGSGGYVDVSCSDDYNADSVTLQLQDTGWGEALPLRVECERGLLKSIKIAIRRRLGDSSSFAIESLMLYAGRGADIY